MLQRQWKDCLCLSVCGRDRLVCIHLNIKHNLRWYLVFSLCMFQFMYNPLLKQSDNSHDLQQISSVREDHTAYQQIQLCGSTGPIICYLCQNGVSCTFEILILKPPPLVESSQGVSVGSSPNEFRVWSCVCVCACVSNKCRQYTFFVMMQRYQLPHGSWVLMMLTRRDH